MIFSILKGPLQDSIRVEKASHLFVERMTSLSEIYSCQILSVEEHDTRYGTFLLYSVTLSGFVQSSLMMQRQNLRGRKVIRTVFLVVNVCSLKAHFREGGGCVLLRFFRALCSFESEL